jgi:thymidylate kinase
MGWYHCMRGRLVIFDRYAYDALLTSRKPRTSFRSLHGWLETHLCPPPDMVILLDAPGDLMYQRKGRRKHTPQELEAARREYREMQDRIPCLTLVDAAQPADEVRSEVLERVWDRYVRRWKGELPCFARSGSRGAGISH